MSTELEFPDFLPRKGDLVGISLFYVDNDEGDYQLYNCSLSNKPRMNALIDRTGSGFNIKKVSVFRWTTLEAWHKREREKKLERQRIRLELLGK